MLRVVSMLHIRGSRLSCNVGVGVPVSTRILVISRFTEHHFFCMKIASCCNFSIKNKSMLRHGRVSCHLCSADDRNCRRSNSGAKGRTFLCFSLHCHWFQEVRHQRLGTRRSLNLLPHDQQSSDHAFESQLLHSLFDDEEQQCS